MIKRIAALILVVLALIAAAIFIYRFQILQYSADLFLRNNLPDYVKIDRINFDARGSKVTFSGFRILNPPGFSNNYLLEISEVSCRYKLKGKDITQGFEIFEPSFIGLLLNVERLGDGRLNLNEMGTRIQKKAVPKTLAPAPKPDEPAPGMAEKKNKLSDIIKIPEQFALRNGKVVFIDRFKTLKPYFLTFENIKAELLLDLKVGYSGINRLSSRGQGNVNGGPSEIIKWNISLDPNTPRLTMSNRFDVSGVGIKQFEPYYSKYSPLIFTGGTFSGLLIFDFNDGSIGSTNEIRLRDIKFYVKPGYENASFWETTVPDLVKYFTTTYDEIVFDFKIKGDMESPRFFLGPISKQAITSLAIDKISATLESMSKSKDGNEAKSDIDKVKDYVELFKGLVNKK